MKDFFEFDDIFETDGPTPSSASHRGNHPSLANAIREAVRDEVEEQLYELAKKLKKVNKRNKELKQQVEMMTQIIYELCYQEQPKGKKSDWSRYGGKFLEVGIESGLPALFKMLVSNNKSRNKGGRYDE